MKSAALRWFIVFVCVFFSKGWSADLHLFIVADVSDEAEGLKEAIQNDIAAVRLEALRVAKNTGLYLKEQPFIGDGISLHRLIAALKKIPASNEDVIFFYFSGHGYTTTSQFDDPWPNLVIRNRGLPFSSVIDILKGSKARLKILFADCCNNIIPDAYAPVLVKKPQAIRGNFRKNYKKLFIEHSGLIIISGCEKSQVSLATPEGSFCSRSFFKSIRKITNGPVPFSSWQEVLDLTAYKLHRYAKKHKKDQDLLFVIEN